MCVVGPFIRLLFILFSNDAAHYYDVIYISHRFHSICPFLFVCAFYFNTKLFNIFLLFLRFAHFSSSLYVCVCVSVNISVALPQISKLLCSRCAWRKESLTEVVSLHIRFSPIYINSFPFLDTLSLLSISFYRRHSLYLSQFFTLCSLHFDSIFVFFFFFIIILLPSLLVPFNRFCCCHIDLLYHPVCVD